MHAATEPPQVTRTSGAIRASGGEPASGKRQFRRSLIQYAPAFVVLLAVMADAMQYADTDLWGHVRFGQIILGTGHLIRHDIFSYSARGAPWIDHEWLSEVVMAGFYNTLGVAGLKLMKFLCAGAIMLLLAADVGETGAAPTAQFAVLIAAAVGLQLQIQFRPQLADYIFVSAILALLARWRRRGRAPLWLILPMMILWANLHGGFFVGVVVLGGYAGVLGLQDLWEGRGLDRALRLGALTVCAAMVTLINPWGFGEWQIVAHTLGNPYTMGFGKEFQSFFHVLDSLYREGSVPFQLLVALGVMAILPITFALAPSMEDLPELAIGAMMVTLALYSVRNTAFAMIACAAPVAWHLDLALNRRRRIHTQSEAAGSSAIGTEPSATQIPLSKGSVSEAAHDASEMPANRASFTVQSVALIAAIALALCGGIFSSRLQDFTGYPVGAVTFMQHHDLSGRVFNRLIWGGYLIWHLAPQSTIFIDGRFEMLYPMEVQAGYITFLRGGAGAKRVLAAYPPDFVLMDTDSPQFRFMMRQEGWRLIYRDPVSALFARTDSAAARIAGVPVLRDKAPPSFFP